MKLKVTEFIVELEIQAVTCPGVWLCPNGKITLHLYMLETCTQTYPLNPVFPLLFHEKFTFKKTFDKVLKLSELQKILAKEIIYIELVQWEDCECPNVLATFRTSVSELLYPLPHSDCLMAGVDVDLLMEGTKHFPGIISPKVEIATKTTIAEVLKPFSKKSKEGIIVNPKLISTNCIPKRNVPLRQRRVCHSYGYHRLKAAKRPQETIVANKKNNPNETEFGRPKTTGSPRNRIDWEIRAPEIKAEYDILKNIKKCTAIPEIKCLCHIGNQLANCKLCTKYSHYFGNSYCNCKSILSESPKLNNCGCVKQHAEEQKKHVPQSPRLNICCNNKKENKFEKTKQDSSGINETNCKCTDIPYASPVSTNRSSLAMELHKRLEKTLGNEQDHSNYSIKDLNTIENGLGADADRKLCKAKFYGNLADFYIELSKRAHRKCKQEI